MGLTGMPHTLLRATASGIVSGLLMSLNLQAGRIGPKSTLLFYFGPGVVFSILVLLPWSRERHSRMRTAGTLATGIIAFPLALLLLDLRLPPTITMGLAGLSGALIVSLALIPTGVRGIVAMAATGLGAGLIGWAIGDTLPADYPWATVKTALIFVVWQVPIAVILRRASAS